jgi:uncharacterized caspase-like protein
LACLLLPGVVLGAGAGERRVALVVGVSAYQHANRLPNTLNDARSIAASLTVLGFDVETITDPDRNGLETAVRRLGDRARGADVSLFYYAGHALEYGGQNWLVPIQADLHTERDVRFETLDVDAVIEQMQGQSRVSLLILDSCRDNPFRHALEGNVRGMMASRGLAAQPGAAGTLIVYATAPGQVAEDGNGPHSPFTSALLHHLEDPGVEIRTVITTVRAEVRKATMGTQVPWDSSSLEGQFFLRPVAADLETIYWESVRSSTDSADLQAYLSRYPNGVFAELARNRIARLRLGDAEQRGAEQKAADAKRLAEQQAATDAAQRLAEQKTADEAAQKLAERRATEEAQRLADQKVAAEAKRLADQKAAADAAQKIADQKAAAEAQRLADQNGAAEAKRLADQKAATDAAQKIADQKAAAEAAQKLAITTLAPLDPAHRPATASRHEPEHAVPSATEPRAKAALLSAQAVARPPATTPTVSAHPRIPSLNEAQCADILQRVQLGEGLSNSDRLLLQNSCRR